MFQTDGNQMPWTATKPHNEATLLGGNLRLTGLSSKMGGAGVVPFIAAIAAYLLGVTITGFVPMAVAIAAGLVGLICLIGIDQLQGQAPTTNTYEATADARLAGLERKNAALQFALDLAQARLSQSIAERDTLAVELTVDPLTGVQNRRGLEAAFADCGAGTVMALLDIDHFKKINDTLGHDVGDRVLRDFAQRLRGALNDSLPIYRIGGEEFVVLFPKAQMETVSALLSDFRTDLQAANVTRTEDGMTVSFSAGLALRMDTAQSFDAIFKQADERLYTAKMTGRAKTVYCDLAPRDEMAIAA